MPAVQIFLKRLTFHRHQKPESESRGGNRKEPESNKPIYSVSTTEANRVYITLTENVCTIFSERELMFTFAICRRASVCLSSVCL